jgi:hypothetical protein
MATRRLVTAIATSSTPNAGSTSRHPSGHRAATTDAAGRRGRRAQGAGLQTGDQLLSINGVAVSG